MHSPGRRKKGAHRRGQANKTHREDKSQNIARLSASLCSMSDECPRVTRGTATHKNQQKSGLERQDTTRHETTTDRMLTGPCSASRLAATDEETQQQQQQQEQQLVHL